jgi:hypothetical protein
MRRKGVGIDNDFSYGCSQCGQTGHESATEQLQ